MFACVNFRGPVLSYVQNSPLLVFKEQDETFETYPISMKAMWVILLLCYPQVLRPPTSNNFYPTVRHSMNSVKEHASQDHDIFVAK